ncbi:MAG: LytR C-terminal domain-containing protein [Candidatus Syntrophosphaera sp.]|nr:LytR C-terminal domain-containing protein [Candidatus Syntrophosphaera sp.]
MTAKHAANNWSPNRGWPLLIILVLALALLVFVYLRFLAPHLGSQEYDEKNLPAIKVMVKNGCGYEKLASDYANHIRYKNIDVVGLGDMPHPIYNKSLIEVKQDDRQDLQRLQKMTGIQRFVLAEDPGSEAPFVIIVGADYEDFMKK